MPTDRKKRRIFGPLTYGTLALSAIAFAANPYFPVVQRRFRAWRAYCDLKYYGMIRVDEPVRTLVNSGEDGRAYLRAAIADRDPKVREAVALAAFETGASFHERILLALEHTDDASPIVRDCALEAIHGLMPALSPDQDQEIRRRVAKVLLDELTNTNGKYTVARKELEIVLCLKQLGVDARSIIPDLERASANPSLREPCLGGILALLDRDNPSRMTAVRACIRKGCPTFTESDLLLGYPYSAEAVLGLLADADPKVRIATIHRVVQGYRLWPLKERVAEAIISLLNDPDPEVRAIVAIEVSRDHDCYPVEDERKEQALEAATLNVRLPQKLRVEAAFALRAVLSHSEENAFLAPDRRAAPKTRIAIVRTLIDQLDANDAERTDAALACVQGLRREWDARFLAHNLPNVLDLLVETFRSQPALREKLAKAIFELDRRSEPDLGAIDPAYRIYPAPVELDFSEPRRNAR